MLLAAINIILVLALIIVSLDIQEPILNQYYLYQKENCTKIEIEISKTQHRFIIGPKGRTLQDILAETGCAVELPRPDALSETVIIRGLPDKIGAALNAVYNKVIMLYILKL